MIRSFPFDEKQEVVFFYAHHGVWLESLWSRIQKEDPTCRQMHTDQLKTFFSENERILNLSGFPRLIGMHCAAWLVIDTYLPEKQVFPEIGKEGISCIPGISREDLPAKLAVLRVNRMIGDHLPILIMAIRDIRDS